MPDLQQQLIDDITDEVARNFRLLAACLVGRHRSMIDELRTAWVQACLASALEVGFGDHVTGDELRAAHRELTDTYNRCANG